MKWMHHQARPSMVPSTLCPSPHPIYHSCCASHARLSLLFWHGPGRLGSSEMVQIALWHMCNTQRLAQETYASLEHSLDCPLNCQTVFTHSQTRESHCSIVLQVLKYFSLDWVFFNFFCATTPIIK